MADLFVWDAEVARAVQRVRAHAEKPENWYRPGPLAKPPGDNALFVVWAGTNKAVFSWTVVPRSWNPRHPPAGSLLRHLSVSVRRQGRYPQPEVVWTLAHHFGFTGATPDEYGICHHLVADWVVGKDDKEGCIVIQQLVDGVTDAPLPSTVQ